MPRRRSLASTVELKLDVLSSSSSNLETHVIDVLRRESQYLVSGNWRLINQLPSGHGERADEQANISLTCELMPAQRYDVMSQIVAFVSRSTIEQTCLTSEVAREEIWNEKVTLARASVFGKAPVTQAASVVRRQAPMTRPIPPRPSRASVEGWGTVGGLLLKVVISP